MLIPPSQPLPIRWLRTLWQTHPPLLISGLLFAAMVVFFGAGILLDGRTVQGVPAWLKPTKFAVSFVIYNLTLLWMLGFVEGRSRLVGALAWLIVATSLIETLAIAGQAARGTTSHYNTATPLDAAVWSVMGATIIVLWLTHLGITLLILFQRFGHPAFALSLRIGLGITLLGLLEAFLMASPLGQALASAGGVSSPASLAGIAGAHSVGVADGGAGLPVLGWSTEGGDLRAGHFIGIHALQVLPLCAWLLTRLRLSVPQQVALVRTAGASYLAFLVLVVWQALRGQPITAPDALTAAVFSAIVLATGGAAALIWRRAAPARAG